MGQLLAGDEGEVSVVVMWDEEDYELDPLDARVHISWGAPDEDTIIAACGRMRMREQADGVPTCLECIVMSMMHDAIVKTSKEKTWTWTP